MSAGKTYWWAKDAAWIDREHVVELGEEHGPAGPLVLDVLCGQAKLENDGGSVMTGFRSLARKAFLPGGSDEARRIVEHAARIGALDDLELDDDGRRFTARISGWQADQGRGYESVRKAQQRAQKPPQDPSDPTGTDRDTVPENGTPSRSVPKCPPTGQDRTEGERAESARDRASESLQHPALPTVLDVFADVPDLVVDPLPVMSTLLAHPWADDERLIAAAHEAAAWAQSPTDPPRIRDAAGLLRLVLRDAARQRINPQPARRPAPQLAAVSDLEARMERIADRFAPPTEGAA